ncbi:MAG: PLP-dependent aspartate aminotransferase family protein [Pseudomonadota bacterium]
MSAAKPGANRLSPATRAAQALGRIEPRTGAVAPPLDLSSTYARNEAYEARQAYIYGRDGGDTLRHAQDVIASLDGAEQTLLFSSGMAAIVTLMECLRQGERVVAPSVMYHGTLTWLHHLAETRGIELTLFDPADPAGLARAVRPDTALIWIETPVNPTWEVIDIAAASQLATSVGAKLAVDCTTAPPCTQDALGLGADIAFHSATKYMGGHSDLVAGALSFAREDAFSAQIERLRVLMGNVLGGFEAWLLIRGLRTLYLRYERASHNALAIAQALEGRCTVLYPGLPSHPSHDIAAAQMTGGFGGMLSLVLPSFEDAAQTVARLQLFVPATSLGGVESLVEHRKVIEGPESPVPDGLLRLSVGIEAEEDLIADLLQALP